MKFTIEYDVCIDDDFPNPVCFAEVEAESEKEAVAKFRERNIIGAVVIGVYKDGESE